MFKKQSKYRGKYPTRINSVYSLKDRKGVVGVTLNNGDRYTIAVKDIPDRMMSQIGREISDYVATPVIVADANPVQQMRQNHGLVSVEDCQARIKALEDLNAELLAALEPVVSRWEGTPNDQTPREVKDARIVIAKARSA